MAKRVSFIFVQEVNRKLQTNYLRNTSNILRWLPGERHQKGQNVLAQKSVPRISKADFTQLD